MNKTIHKITLTAESDAGVKAPSFATGSPEFLNPVTGETDVVLATEQQMRHIYEETIFDKNLLIPAEPVKDIPYVLLLGDGKTAFSCSSRELSHRVADSQLLAAYAETDKKMYNEMKNKSWITDLIVQYLDPITFIGGYWFSYWESRVNNNTAASASLLEASIVAHGAVPQLSGSTKFSRLKVSDETFKKLGAKGTKQSNMGFGMIPSNSVSGRYVFKDAELTLIDLRRFGLSRMKSRGAHETTINLVSSIMDLIILNLSDQSEFSLRAKSLLKVSDNVEPIGDRTEIENKVKENTAKYLEAREDNFGNNEQAKEIREYFEQFDRDVFDAFKESRPNALVLKSAAIAQDSSDENAGN